MTDSPFPNGHLTVFVGIGLSLLFIGAFRLTLAVSTAGFAVAWVGVLIG